MEKIRAENGGAEIERDLVDRDGYFFCDGKQMMICGHEGYHAKVVHRRNGEIDILFDMDTILRCGDTWYDQNGYRMHDECVRDL